MHHLTVRLEICERFGRVAGYFRILLLDHLEIKRHSFFLSSPCFQKNPFVPHYHRDERGARGRGRKRKEEEKEGKKRGSAVSLILDGPKSAVALNPFESALIYIWQCRKKAFPQLLPFLFCHFRPEKNEENWKEWREIETLIGDSFLLFVLFSNPFICNFAQASEISPFLTNLKGYLPQYTAWLWETSGANNEITAV